MLCPKCKNPIADNASACEWCGTSFAVVEEKTQQAEQPKMSDLDVELCSLLRQGKKANAIELYKQRTGANASDSLYYVARIMFFLQHASATENMWQKHVKKSKTAWFMSRLVSWIVLPFAFFCIIGMLTLVFGGNSEDFAGGVIGLIFFLIVAFSLIYWIYKTKKIKI